jgi:hypothetical protein
MDEKRWTPMPRATPLPTTIQSKPAHLEAAEIPPKMSGAVDSRQTRTVDSSPATAPKTDKASQSGGLTMVLEASRAELDRLLAETQNLHERSWRAIHTLLEDSQLRASQAVDACLTNVEKDIQARVGSEMAMMLENFELEADARLAARLDQALATAKQRQHSIEQELAVAVAENQKQLDRIATSATDGLRQSQQSLLGDLQKEAERQLAELAQKADQISTGIRHLSDNLGAELKQRTEDAVQVFQSRIEQVWQELAGRAEQRIAESSRTCIAELAQQARQVVDREMSEFLGQVLRRFTRSSDAPPPNQDTSH